MARRLGLCDECIGPIGVNPIRVRKSFGSDTAFSEDLVGSSKIESGVLAMADEV